MQCTDAVIEKWDKWIVFLTKTYELFLTKKTKDGTICSCIYQRSKKCKLSFIVAFKRALFNRHLACKHRTHRIDERTGQPGHLCHEVLSHLAVTEKEIYKMNDDWENNSYFTTFIV